MPYATCMHCGQEMTGLVSHEVFRGNVIARFLCHWCEEKMNSLMQREYLLNSERLLLRDLLFAFDGHKVENPYLGWMDDIKSCQINKDSVNGGNGQST